MALWFCVNINFYCTMKNDIALGASASCNIIFLSAIKIDIALTQVPYLYNILIQYHGNYMEMKIFNYMLEIDILRNFSQNFLGVLRGAFLGFGCPKRHPEALLAYTMLPDYYFNPYLLSSF